MAEEIKRLKELLVAKGKAKGSKKPKFKLNYSLSGRQRRSKRGQQATGRYPQAQKSAQVSASRAIYPDGIAPEACEIQRHQYIWRIIDGKAQYVDYEIYAAPENANWAEVPGVRNRRSEYGLEIILMVAFLHYWIGISLDHVCEVLQFFTGLELSKSQANALLNQLSADWQEEYDRIADLLAVEMVIYIDETGWKVGAQPCYTWAFSSLMYVLFRCGVGRGKAEAQAILGERFGGIGVRLRRHTVDVYRSEFDSTGPSECDRVYRPFVCATGGDRVPRRTSPTPHLDCLAPRRCRHADHSAARL